MPPKHLKAALAAAASTCLLLSSPLVSQSADAISPSPEALQEFVSAPEDGPVVMLNLLDFVDDGGAESYAKYGAATLPFLQKARARILYRGVPVDMPNREVPWDEVALVQYPSRAAFLEMVSHPDYQKGLEHRSKGLERTVLYAMTSNDGKKLSDVALSIGDQADSEVFVVNLLRFKQGDGRARYANYAEVAARLIAELGGRVEYDLEPQSPLVSREIWERFALVRYPSLETLLQMTNTSDWQTANQDRQAGLDATWAFPTRPLPPHDLTLQGDIELLGLNVWDQTMARRLKIPMELPASEVLERLDIMRRWVVAMQKGVLPTQSELPEGFAASLEQMMTSVSSAPADSDFDSALQFIETGVATLAEASGIELRDPTARG